MSIEYKLKNGRILYYSPLHCRFSLDVDFERDEVRYANTELNYLRLEISHACNGNCNYCIVFGNEIQDLSHINIQEFWNWLIVQDWYDKITGIFVIGGEPLLFFDELLYLMNNFKGDIHFSTNGTLITREMAREFKKRDVLVYVSLDGLTRKENLNRVYATGQSMFDDIFNGLNYLEEEKVRKGIFMVATHENIENIVQTMIELSRRYNLLRIGYSLPHWTIHEKNVVTAEEYGNALCELYDNRDKIKADVMQIEWRLYPILSGITKKFSCALHTEQMTILPDMSIVRCSKIDHDMELKRITNLQLDEGCPVSNYRTENYKCKDCIAVGSCGGGCPYDGLKRFGSIIDQRECEITPKIVEKAVNDILKAFNDSIELCNMGSGLVNPEAIKAILIKRG